MSSSFPGSRLSINFEPYQTHYDVRFPENTEYIVLESVTLNNETYRGPGEIVLRDKGASPQDERRFTDGDAWPFNPEGTYELTLEGDTVAAGDELEVNFVLFTNLEYVPRLIGGGGFQETHLTDPDGAQIDPARAWDYQTFEVDDVDLTAGTHTVGGGFFRVRRCSTVRVYVLSNTTGGLDVSFRWRDTQNATVTMSEDTVIQDTLEDWAVVEVKGRWCAIDLEDNSGASSVDALVVTEG